MEIKISWKIFFPAQTEIVSQQSSTFISNKHNYKQDAIYGFCNIQENIEPNLFPLRN